VDPILRVNKKEIIPLECVSLQTVLSKSLGPLTEWRDRLMVSISCRYVTLLIEIHYFSIVILLVFTNAVL